MAGYLTKDGEALAAKLRLLLDDADCRRKTLHGLAEVTEKLGPPGCAERAAELALACIRPEA